MCIILFLYVYLLMCIWTCMCRCKCKCVYGYVKARSWCHVSSCCFLWLFWDRISQWNWSSPIQPDWMTSEPQWSCVLLSIAGITGCTWLVPWVRGMDSDPHVCVASTLLTKASPYLSIILFWSSQLPCVTTIHSHISPIKNSRTENTTCLRAQKSMWGQLKSNCQYVFTAEDCNKLF